MCITLTTGDSGNDTFSGVISGSGNLAKAGSGTFTLSGTNTYTGTASIFAGTISISADSGLGVARFCHSRSFNLKWWNAAIYS